ncbi:MAG: hypothetical protein LBJ31_08300 [Treponema sp.]|jgi:filamentous hemagglutinin|nr:hypothetical protein [Treponema sp.]
MKFDGLRKSDNKWALSPFARGRRVERALGTNLPCDFPVIDRFRDGIATSIKSLDIRSRAYRNAAVLAKTVKTYIESAAGFNGLLWEGAAVRPGDIKGRALELAIPCPGSGEQAACLQNMVVYGKTIGVNVTLLVKS